MNGEDIGNYVIQYGRSNALTPAEYRARTEGDRASVNWPADHYGRRPRHIEAMPTETGQQVA